MTTFTRNSNTCRIFKSDLHFQHWNRCQWTTICKHVIEINCQHCMHMPQVYPLLFENFACQIPSLHLLKNTLAPPHPAILLSIMTKLKPISILKKILYLVTCAFLIGNIERSSRKEVLERCCEVTWPLMWPVQWHAWWAKSSIDSKLYFILILTIH